MARATRLTVALRLAGVSRCCLTLASQSLVTNLLQARVLRLGGDGDGNVRVSVIPERTPNIYSSKGGLALCRPVMYKMALRRI